MFGQILYPNDRVLLRNVPERGGKLRSYWEKDIYVVVLCDPELPVYKIKPEIDNKRVKQFTRTCYSNVTNYLLTTKTFESDTEFYSLTRTFKIPIHQF